MEQLKALLSELQSRFQQLSARERRLVTFAGSALAVFVLFLILFSFSSSAASYRRRTAEILTKLKEVQQLAATYREAEQVRLRTERELSASNVSLISYLEDKGTKAGLSIPTLNPKGDVPLGDGKIIESGVEVMLPDIPITKLVSFLSDVERGPGVVKVKLLRIEPRPASDNLTAWVTVTTYRLKP